MNIEPGLAVVIAATLIFYLRLIILQREKAKRAAQAIAEARQTGAKMKRKGSPVSSAEPTSFSILSPRRSDWIIAGLGLLAILLGILLNRGLVPLPNLQPYWWASTSTGILAFSWAFRL
jgi:hypothetical protein